MAERAGRQRVILAALAANLVIATCKLVAATVSRSTAMLAEACHSLADSANQVFLLIGLRRSARPPDARRPFGHGRESYFWAFMVALCIFGVGGGVSIDEGVRKILHRRDGGLGDVRFAYAVLAASFALEGWSFRVALTEFHRVRAGRSLRRTFADARDPTVLTVLFEDAAALFGLVVATGGVALTQLTRDPIYDGAASIVVGLSLCAAAWVLGRDSRSLLIGEAASPSDQRTLEAIVLGHPDVCELVHQRTLHLGPEEVMAAIKVRFRSDLDTRALERSINEIEGSLRAALPGLVRIYIEPGFDERARAGEPAREGA